MAHGPRYLAGTALVVLSVAGGCGADEEPRPGAGSTTHEDSKRGYSVSVPSGWQRAPKPLTPRLTEPREVLALGTFPLRYRSTNCEAFAGSAMQDLGPEDAFLTVWERGFDRRSERPDFTPRPAHFRPVEPQPLKASSCEGAAEATLHWLNFTDAGRHFHVQVAIGRSAPEEVRRAPWRILDSLRLDPEVKPDWKASS